MPTSKPLPVLPLFPTLTTLSVDSRQHLARLIRHSLSSLNDSESAEEWATALEGSLDELGECVANGGWIEGIKKSRLSSSKAVEKAGERESDKTPTDQLRNTGSGSKTDSNFPSKRLLLCVAPLGSTFRAAPVEDSGFDVIPVKVGCTFTSALFPADDSTSVLYGSKEWAGNAQVKLVGGTFTFKGVTSPSIHSLLRRTLRLAIYTHLSLILEQHLLSDLNVDIVFPSPVTSPNSTPPPLPPPLDHRASSTGSAGSKHGRKHSFIPSGILSIFSPSSPTSTKSKASNLKSLRALRSLTTSPRGGSLDLRREPSLDTNIERAKQEEERPSSGGRFRRFSFIPADPRPSFLKSPTFSPPPAPPAPDTSQIFRMILKRLNERASLYSTSPHLPLSPPPLIVSLSHKEELDPRRKLTGDERVGLKSLKVGGWSDVDGNATSLLEEFAKMQQISFLFSSHVPSLQSPSAEDSGSIKSVASIKSNQEEDFNQPIYPTVYSPCGRPRWVSFKHYYNPPEPSASDVSDASSALNISRSDNQGTAKSAVSGTSTPSSPMAVTFPSPVVVSSGGADPTVGSYLTSLITEAGMKCDVAGCRFKRGEHLVRWMHERVRIDVSILDASKLLNEEKKDLMSMLGDGDEWKGEVLVWQKCKICGEETERKRMGDGTYISSFSKFLELLVYSPALASTSPSLCEHTTPPASKGDEKTKTLPHSRFNFLRRFQVGPNRRKLNQCAAIVEFKLSGVEDVYELRVPRLQITSYGVKKDGATSIADTNQVKSSDKGKEDHDEEKRILRREIREWYEGMGECIDRLEEMLSDEANVRPKKSLPRLPSQYEEDEDEDEEPEQVKTPKAMISGLPPASPTTPSSVDPRGYFARPPSLASTATTPKALAHANNKELSATSTESLSPRQLLSNMRYAFQNDERTLYGRLAKTSESSLNDVRRAFLSTGRGTSKRLCAWQRKHLSTSVVEKDKNGEESGITVVAGVKVKEPSWWAKTCHAFPGGNVIVREDDWGSIIAYTLGSADFQRELANMSVARTSSTVSSSSNAPLISPALSSTSTDRTSFFAAPRFFSSSQPTALPDPDRDDAVWDEPEPYSAVVSRKEHPRENALSLRDVLRQKVPSEAGSNSATGTITTMIPNFGSVRSSSGSRSGIMPPSAYAKPAEVMVSKQDAGGEVSTDGSSIKGGGTPGESSAAGKILHEIDSTAAIKASSDMSSSLSTLSSEFPDSHVRRGKTRSILSLDSNATIGRDDEGDGEREVPVPPPKDIAERLDSAPPTPPASSGFMSLTNSLATAMRFMLNNPDSTSLAQRVTGKNHHGLLSLESLHIDARPHIKYDWTIGKRLKFSCTVYYARQFDAMRKRCGIDDTFLKSLGKSANWAAEGGKSKSNFWKTEDDRFIIKTLVNAWNVADLQVLLELAPSYFKYIDSTTSKATVLAKLVGFYTIEIRNLETGAVQSKADLLVMENLFYEQNIVKTFDLKGIQGRRVKAAAQTSKTLFDGEWIEGQQRTLTLIRPHSKLVLREAIKADAEFLAKSNIMDYSLLLGVDENRKQIACGLVDTIGSYTFAKTLEYKAKQGLNSGKEVTVIPPAEYQERFVNALEGYFLSCPDKWSKPVDESTIVHDLEQLPSVL